MTDGAFRFQPDLDRVHRFLVGFLLAAALTLVEAGVAEILLARNAACVDSLVQFRLSPDPFAYCMSEFSYHLAGSASHAFAKADAPALLVFPLLAAVYGLIGGGLAQLDLRRAVFGYLAAHILLLIVFTVVRYLSQFIV